MGISSLGVGSGILTQSVLDQLRAADDAQRITPLTLNITNENDKSAARDILDATMVNFRDAANELKNTTLFDARTASVTGTSVGITADVGSDIQNFTLNVTQLAKKQISESASYTADTALIATGTGSLNLAIGATSYSINYDATTTLKDLKNTINKIAGVDVNASVVQVATGDFRLFLSAANEGAAQSISLTDTNGLLAGTQLTTGLSTIQAGQDATFDFNGQAITRSSNTVTDLVSGYTMSLKEIGSSTVNVSQDRTNLETRVDSFVSQYNAAINELSKQTKSSTDSTVRGIFSGDSIVKSMKTTLENMFGSISNVGGNLQNYGFSVDRSGVMSVDKTVLNATMDANPNNVKAFFSGGDYTSANGTVTTLTGAFSSYYTTANSFTKLNGDLDQVKNSISENLINYNDRKTSATKRLDSKYAILKRKFAAYDSIINKFNSTSSMFTQLSNPTTGA